jgi:hypothetical protein
MDDSVQYWSNQAIYQTGEYWVIFGIRYAYELDSAGYYDLLAGYLTCVYEEDMGLDHDQDQGLRNWCYSIFYSYNQDPDYYDLISEYPSSFCVASMDFG